MSLSFWAAILSKKPRPGTPTTSSTFSTFVTSSSAGIIALTLTPWSFHSPIQQQWTLSCWILWPLCWVLNCKVTESALLILERPSEGRCLPCGPQLRLRQGPDLPPSSPLPLPVSPCAPHCTVALLGLTHSHTPLSLQSCVLFLDGLRIGRGCWIMCTASIRHICNFCSKDNIFRRIFAPHKSA